MDSSLGEGLVSRRLTKVRVDGINVTFYAGASCGGGGVIKDDVIVVYTERNGSGFLLDTDAEDSRGKLGEPGEFRSCNGACTP